jgi:hypothetical protein
MLRFADESPLELWISDYWRGLPAGSERFIQARPNTVVPAYSGDVTIVLSRERL